MGNFLPQLIKILANVIMWSSYDFMQCERSPDTISVSIHNIHINFTFKQYNKIIAKKKNHNLQIKNFLKIFKLKIFL